MSGVDDRRHEAPPVTLDLLLFGKRTTVVEAWHRTATTSDRTCSVQRLPRVPRTPKRVGRIGRGSQAAARPEVSSSLRLWRSREFGSPSLKSLIFPSPSHFLCKGVQASHIGTTMCFWLFGFPGPYQVGLRDIQKMEMRGCKSYEASTYTDQR